MPRTDSAPPAKRRRLRFRRNVATPLSGAVRVRVDPTLGSGTSMGPAPGVPPPASPRPRKRRPEKISSRPRGWAWGGALAVALGVFAWPAALSSIEYSREQVWGIDITAVAGVLRDGISSGSLPRRVELTANDMRHDARLQYSFDWALQGAIQEQLQRYRPDYAAVVALDPDTGRVLAMASSNRREADLGNLALRSSYPGASVFKLVTAAAAIDQGKVGASTVIPYNGKSTSLYKNNVLKHKDNQWTRRPTLREAFAKSVNTIFARLGLYYVGGDMLQDYAGRFGFNGSAESDLPIPFGSTDIDLDDPWSIAEAASGYTRSNTLSPLHGAMLAATVVNDGLMRTPYIVDTLSDAHGVVLYEAEPRSLGQVITAETAREMRVLMRETVRSGSARSSFSGFFKGPLVDLDVGGKTGSLSGLEPKGRYDWFVGYADGDGKRLAFAVVCINIEKWYVKSSYLARKALEAYYAPI